jgi:hypothetical protein
VRLPQAALALLCAAVAPGCANEDKPVQVDARALAAAGFAAVGADSVGVRVTAERREGVVHVHASGPPGEGLLTVLPMFERVHARIETFCPPPGILRCIPTLRVSGAIRAVARRGIWPRRCASSPRGPMGMGRWYGAAARRYAFFRHTASCWQAYAREAGWCSCPLGVALSRRVPRGRPPDVWCSWRGHTLSAHSARRYRRRRARRWKGRGAWPS